MKTVNLEKIVAETKELPILSDTADRVIEYLLLPESTTAKLSEVIESDPILASTLLKTVNSNLFGFNREIYTVNQALVTLGFDAVKNLIITLSILKAKKLDDFPFDLTVFSEDSFTTAVAAKLLIRNFEPSLEAKAFTIGMILNVGKPLFALHYPQQYKKLSAQAKSSDKSLNEFERKTFLWDHTRLGAMLVKRWGFDESYVLPIFYHHTPDPPVEKVGIEWILIATAYLSNSVLEVFRSLAKKESLEFCVSEARRRLDLSEDIMHQILEDIGVQRKVIAECFSFNLTFPFSYSKVLHAINIQLGEINLTYEQMMTELRKAKAEAEQFAHQLRLANEELKKQADNDGLTGIFNHRYFQEHLAVEFMRAVRYGSSLALIVFDVDFFKKVNDVYGHLAGDHALKEIAWLLKMNTRMSDIVARYGGEEFAVVLPETNMENAYLVAEKIRNKIENHPFIYKDNNINITVSAGVSSMEAGRTYETANELINSADKKLYRAKKGGRNQVVK